MAIFCSMTEELGPPPLCQAAERTAFGKSRPSEGADAGFTARGTSERSVRAERLAGAGHTTN